MSEVYANEVGPLFWRTPCRIGNDYACHGATTSSWEAFCSNLEAGGLIDTSYSGASVPTAYYAKCYNESGAGPLNYIRFAYASQIGTTNLDPELPRMNQINRTNCRRILQLF